LTAPLPVGTGKVIKVKFSRLVRSVLTLYEWLWRAATPLISRNQRLKEGLPQRNGERFPKGSFDIWIQAASAGEAYLAALLLDHLEAAGAYRILVTTNTRQGKDIIEAALNRRPDQTAGTRLMSAYFPFDRPSLMTAAVRAIQPRCVVLLETEIWPGLLHALKRNGIACIIVNARMRSQSLRHYLLWPKLWRSLTPERILAVSPADAKRYARLYGAERVTVMPNMKFDRIRADLSAGPANPVRHLAPADCPMVVLGSVRREEEDAVGRLIAYLRDRRPDLIIGLFPRHMHRVGPWQERLTTAGIPFRLRSRTTDAPPPGSVILWDVFGELTKAYAAACGVFVGGTLAPLGGQNFLEPLTCGLVPVIGPSYETFAWVGRDLFAKGLVRVAEDWRRAADMLLELLAAPPSKKTIKKALGNYLQEHQGGTAIAVAAIKTLLDHKPPTETHRQGSGCLSH